METSMQQSMMGTMNASMSMTAHNQQDAILSEVRRLQAALLSEQREKEKALSDRNILQKKVK